MDPVSISKPSFNQRSLPRRARQEQQDQQEGSGRRHSLGPRHPSLHGGGPRHGEFLSRIGQSRLSLASRQCADALGGAGVAGLRIVAGETVEALR